MKKIKHGSYELNFYIGLYLAIRGSNWKLHIIILMSSLFAVLDHSTYECIFLTLQISSSILATFYNAWHQVDSQLM